jgi:hypothetical protein
VTIPFTGSATILGRREFIQALGNLPGRVAKKVMDEWTYRQALQLSRAARAAAPRDRRRPRKKPESLRLWRQIRASRVRNLKKFPGSVSRAIAYGAQSGGRVATRLNAARAARAKKGSPRRRRGLPTVALPRGYHFNIVASTTANMRRQKTTGKSTGRMWTRTANTRFWQRVTERSLANAQGEVGARLRDSYDEAIQREINRLQRRYV